jgi:hypothetical protein
MNPSFFSFRSAAIRAFWLVGLSCLPADILLLSLPWMATARVSVAFRGSVGLKPRLAPRAHTAFAEDGWYCVLAKPHIAHFKVLRARDTAVALCGRIRAHLVREVAPELTDVRIVRGLLETR